MGTSKILIDGVGIDLTADTVAADKLLSGTKAHDSSGNLITGSLTPGITPAGTKNITANGTHDVTAFASAAVNVVSLGQNTEVIVATVASTKTADFVIANSDTVKNHYDDPNLKISISKMDDSAVEAGTAVISVCKNSLINNEAYGIRVYNSTSGVLTGSSQDTPLTHATTDSGGRIYITESGDIHFVGGQPRVRADDYRIIISW